MKSKSSTGAGSIVLTAFVVLAIASAIISAFYVSGMIGKQSEQSTSTSGTTLASPGGFLLARNATATFCTMSSAGNSSETVNANGTSTTTSTSDCLPIGYR